MTTHTHHKIRSTSSEAYHEIQADGLLDTRLEEVFNYVSRNQGQTALEIQNNLGYDEPNKVRPRISDLVRMGKLVYGEKRKTIYSKMPQLEVYTVRGFEQKYLNKLGFKEKEQGLYVFYYKDIILFQDFRGNGRRKSYAFNEEGEKVNYKDLEIWQTFKLVLGVSKDG